MKRLQLFLAFTAILIFFGSCKHAGVTGLPVPKDADMVVHINGSSLNSKVNWAELKQTEWFTNSMDETRDSFHRMLLNDPESSGIDIKSDFIYFTKRAGNSGYMVFEGNLKNADAFEAFIKKMHKGGGEAQKKGDLQYINTGNSNLVSWN